MKFTIITVVKNDKKNLSISLKSALSQKYKSFEYLIFDGLPNNKTEKFIKKNIKNKNIKYISELDKNYYDGLNKAVKYARGEYIGILNAGDRYVNPNILKIISDEIKKNKSDILFGNLLYLNNKKKVTRVWNYQISNLNKFTALKIASPTIFIKKKILLSNPYDTYYNISSDTNFNLNISNKNLRFTYLNKYLIFMKTGGMSTSFKYFFKKLFEDLLILKNFFGIIFPGIYLYKIFFKLKSFILIKKKLVYK